MVYLWSRPRSKSRTAKFDIWITGETWSFLNDIEDADSKAAAFVGKIDEEMDCCFPWKMFMSKLTDDPWISPAIKREI